MDNQIPSICSFIEPENVNREITNSKFNILSTNIRSLNTNFQNLVYFLVTNDIEPDIICMTEIWKPGENNLNIQGYAGPFTKTRF